jgi:hypothetical protein
MTMFERGVEIEVACGHCQLCNPTRRASMDGRQGVLYTMDLDQRAWRWTDKDGKRHTCPEERLKEIPKKKDTAYWGVSQDDPAPEREERREVPKTPETKPATVPEGVADFGYGPACAICHAGFGETHALDCDYVGKMRLNETLSE